MPTAILVFPRKTWAGVDNGIHVEVVKRPPGDNFE